MKIICVSAFCLPSAFGAVKDCGPPCNFQLTVLRLASFEHSPILRRVGTIKPFTLSYYPEASLRFLTFILMVAWTGIEPVTQWLTFICSTCWAISHKPTVMCASETVHGFLNHTIRYTTCSFTRDGYLNGLQRHCHTLANLSSSATQHLPAKGSHRITTLWLLTSN